MIGTAWRLPYFIKINCAQCLPIIIRACASETKSLNGKDADVLCGRVTAEVWQSWTLCEYRGFGLKPRI